MAVRYTAKRKRWKKARLQTMELTISRAAIEHANGVLVCALQVVSSIGRDKLVVPRMLVWETDIRVSVCSKIFLTYRDIKFAAFRLIYDLKNL
jgi:hypothetical protein